MRINIFIRASGIATATTLLALSILPVGAEEPIAPSSSDLKAHLSLADAVKTALEQDAAIRIEKTSVSSAEGKARSEAGPFDLVIEPAARYGKELRPLNSIERIIENQNVITEEQNSQSISATKKFRNGISVTPSVQTQQLKDNSINTGRQRIASSLLNLQLDVPLLRGLGSAASASERSAKLNVSATKLRFQHFVSQRIFEVAAHYLALVTAREEVKLLNDSVSREEKIYEMVKTLVQLDEVPSMEKIQQESSLSALNVRKLNAEQRLSQTKTELSRLMGLKDSGDLPREIRLDELPEIGKDDIFSTLLQSKETLIQHALSHRGDLEATSIDKDRGEILVDAGKNHLLPEVNLQGNAGYRGIKEGSSFQNNYSSAVEHLRGLNWSVGVVASVPWNNDLARGDLQTLTAELEKSTIQHEDLSNSIRANINQQLMDLENYRNQLIQAKRASELAFKATEDRKTLFKEGHATLIEIDLSENDLIGSLLDYNQAKLNYFITVMRLRFETATLLHEEKDGIDVDLENMMKLPDLDGFLRSNPSTQESKL